MRCKLHLHRAKLSKAKQGHLLSSFVVEWLKPSAGVRLLFLVRQAFTAVRTWEARTLPSSTPHWSKLLMPQMKPCADTLVDCCTQMCKQTRCMADKVLRLSTGCGLQAWTATTVLIRFTWARPVWSMPCNLQYQQCSKPGVE